MALAFDEMRGSNGQVRPAYAGLDQWLRDLSPDVLDRRRREAELLFRRIGITFAVYGEAESTERLIPFDVLPRIIAAAEWISCAPASSNASKPSISISRTYTDDARCCAPALSLRTS